MARGNLRAPAPASQRFERLFEGQRDLMAVPPARQMGSYCLAPVQFHSKTREAQRARPFYRRVVVVRAETVARLALAAARAQYCRATFLGLCCPKRGRHPPLAQRELPTACLTRLC
jgi:hypothetical protein